MAGAKTKVAVCLPSKDEWLSLGPLLLELEELSISWNSVDLHVIVSDDGSSDGTVSRVQERSSSRLVVSVVRSVVSRGKTHALSEGFLFARAAGAEYIFMMDADGQDDPKYLPEMLDVLMSGNEVVNGRRVNREHSFIKRQSSRLFNGLVRLSTGLPIWDVNSGLKGFTRVASEYLDVYLYGELHRVILAVAYLEGFAVSEVRVRNRKRTGGSSKYGLTRGWRGFRDLMGVTALRHYSQRPGHPLTTAGGLLLVGTIAWALINLFFPRIAAGSALLWLPDMFLLLGLAGTFFAIGFLADVTLFLNRHLHHAPHRGAGARMLVYSGLPSGEYSRAAETTSES